MSWTRPRLLAAVVAVVALVAVAVAACGAAPPSPTPPPSPSLDASPAPARSPTVPSSASPTSSPAGGAPSATPLTGPAADVRLPGPGWTVASIAEPSLAYAIPPYWQQLRLRDFRADLALAVGDAEGQVRDELEWILGMVDEGRLRSVAIGPSTMGDFTSTLFVFVEDGDATVADAADRRLAEQDEHLPGRRLASREAEDLPAGDALRVIRHSAPTDLPIQNVEYVLLTPGGRTLAIVATGPRDEAPFADFARAIAESLVLGPGL